MRISSVRDMTYDSFGSVGSKSYEDGRKEFLGGARKPDLDRSIDFLFTNKLLEYCFLLKFRDPCNLFMLVFGI
ncbi:hypothetical protein LINGRAPRIM_LOCUS1220 [Linum grandiflorum]